MDDETDPHPDDAETERLLALMVAELRAPEGEKDMDRYLDLQEQLRALYQPVTGIDYDPPSTAIGADPLVTPGDLLAPRSPWMRQKVFNFSGPNVPEGFRPITPEGFKRTIYTMVPDAEAVCVDALKVTDRSSDSKLLAGRLIAHHVLHDLQPPAEVKQALATALGLTGKRVNTPARLAAEAAYESMSFHDIIVALGLANADGALRQQVIEKLRPGQRFGVRGDTRADYLRAVDAETDERIRRGDWSKQAMSQLAIAAHLGWKKRGKFHIGIIRHWTASEQWKNDCASVAFWKAKPLRAAIDLDAQAVVNDVDRLTDAALAALVGVEPKIVRWWRNRIDWPQRVRTRSEIMLAAAEAARSHDEEIYARQAAQALSRESN
ncbi:hypothetical protein [Mesorhizobium australicum]|uniref:Uncharacterized protein n=1 Tax=Mesorhizobium australicum TaxID=536018 RepID=A0A1X7P014_9HYPH|nr:hypothetical protein [Mesorhizobium australicum]SMH43462.1 hypothetical protein SAMN02982922_2908 [Mesorhizobium australicum]